MELQIVSNKEVVEDLTIFKPKEQPIIELIQVEKKKYKINPFIEANTKDVSLSTLRNDCIIPVFSKDSYGHPFRRFFRHLRQ